MNDERAIEELEEFLVIDDWSAVYMPYLQDAIEYVINRIKAVRWIPVSERLPNCNGVYTVTRIIDGTRLTDVCYFDGQNTWHSDICVNHRRPYLNDIIAWRPRPEPYTESEDK